MMKLRYEIIYLSNKKNEKCILFSWVNREKIILK